MKKAIAILTLIVAATTLTQTAARAQQYETQLVALIDKRPYVIEAPYPFLEASRILPDFFAQRRRSIAATNRLIAWYIPTADLKDILNEKTQRYRSLQIQIMKEMEPVQYGSSDVKRLRDELLRTSPNLTTITEDGADDIFKLFDLSRLSKQASDQKILGISNLGADSFTLCIATSAEGRDKRGGYEIETSVTSVTHMLLNGKVILLTVSGPELSAKELRNTMRLTREWIMLLRASNPSYTSPTTQRLIGG